MPDNEDILGSSTDLPAPAAQRLRNRFDRMEWAGAFGDLGTLIPFVLAYVSVMGLDPLGVLLGFGVCMVASGLWYQTPFPVQPMKALGVVATTQAAQTATITPQAVYGAGLVTGVLWLVLGLTGATRWVTSLVSRPVVVGIVLGLGLGFMLEGIKFMAVGWLLSAVVFFVALLLSSRRVPAIFVILVGGATFAVIRDPVQLALGSYDFSKDKRRALRNNHYRRPVDVEYRTCLRDRPIGLSFVEARLDAALIKVPQLKLRRARASSMSASVRLGYSAMSAQWPVYPRKRTQVGHRDMSEKCQWRTSVRTPLMLLPRLTASISPQFAVLLYLHVS